jgi:hypothetical protein
VAGAKNKHQGLLADLPETGISKTREEANKKMYSAAFPVIAAFGCKSRK